MQICVFDVFKILNCILHSFLFYNLTFLEPNVQLNSKMKGCFKEATPRDNHALRCFIPGKSKWDILNLPQLFPKVWSFSVHGSSFSFDKSVFSMGRKITLSETAWLTRGQSSHRGFFCTMFSWHDTSVITLRWFCLPFLQNAGSEADLTTHL